MQRLPFCFASFFSTWVLLSFLTYNQVVFAQVANPVKKGLVVRFAFDSTVKDSSSNHNDLSGTGIFASDRHGLSNGSLSLDGKTALLATNGLPIGRDFSVACWINPSQVLSKGKLASIISVESIPNFALYFNLGLSGDSGLGFRFQANGADQPIVNFRPPNPYNDSWAHLTVTRVNTTLKLFLNGDVRDSSTVVNSLASGLNTPMLVGGSSLISNFGFGGFYSGLLDELRIYNRGLSQVEIDSLAEITRVAIRHNFSNSVPIQIFTLERFRSENPDAELYSLTGSRCTPNCATTGLFVCMQGRSRRRVILQ